MKERFDAESYEFIARERIDHAGRPKVDHTYGDNQDRHEDNLSRLHGVWYNGYFYWYGEALNE